MNQFEHCIPVLRTFDKFRQATKHQAILAAFVIDPSFPEFGPDILLQQGQVVIVVRPEEIVAK